MQVGVRVLLDEEIIKFGNAFVPLVVGIAMLAFDNG